MIDVLEREKVFIEAIFSNIEKNDSYFINLVGRGIVLERPTFAYIGGRYVEEAPCLLLEPYVFSIENFNSIGKISSEELKELFLKLLINDFSKGDIVEITRGSLSGYRGIVLDTFLSFCFIYLTEERICIPHHVTALRKVSDLLSSVI